MRKLVTFTERSEMLLNKLCSMKQMSKSVIVSLALEAMYYAEIERQKGDELGRKYDPDDYIV